MQLNIMYRKALYVFLSVYLVIFSTPSFAQNPPPGGWKWDNARVTVEKDMQRIRLGVEAQKTYPVAIVDPKTNKITQNVLKAQKSAIKITPTANKVGKTLLKRNPYGAITQAVTALLGKAVDWVLDPENNRIKYKDDDVGDGNASAKTLYGVALVAGTYYTYYPSAQKAAEALCSARNLPLTEVGSNFVWCGSNRYAMHVMSNPDYNPDAPTGDDWQYIPIDTVAQQVIDQAEDGQAPALEVMSDTALDMLEAGELDSALDAAAEPKQYGENEYPPDAVPDPKPDTGTDPETPTDPENPNPNPNPDPMPTEWPAFCDWATLACDYYDWAMGAWEPPEGENNEVDIQQPDIGDWQSKANASYVQFDGQCPADVTIPINYMGAATNLSISYQPFCHFASMIKPAVILGAWISAMLIISGGRAKES